MVQKIEAAVGGDLSGKSVAVLGLSYKPNTDDVRDSPAIDIIRQLQDRGARVKSFDPHAMATAARELKDVEFGADAYSTLEGCDVLVLATEWNEFRMLDFDRIRELLREPVVVDLRNIYEPEAMARQGFRYSGVGR
jgi:UDPglucose 6-dehydrogenase